MGIVTRHDAVGIPLAKDNSRFNMGMQMVQRQQERDDAMRKAQMQPLKYNTGGTYGGIGVGDQKKKAKPGVGAEPVFGVDPVLPQQPSMPSWQQDNEEIQRMIDAGGFGYGVSRQLTSLIERENTLRNNTRLNDAQKAEGLARILRNKNALVGTSSLDPEVANTVRDNPPDAFDAWATANPNDYITQYNNARTQWMEQNPGKTPEPSQILGLLREPWDARKPKPAKPPAAAPGAVNNADVEDDDGVRAALNDDLYRVQNPTVANDPYWQNAGRRYGGPVYPGQTVTVGEEGPEMMRVGYDGVAEVTPNPATQARMQDSMSNRKRMNALQTFRAKPEVYKDYLSRADLEADKLGIALSAQQKMQRAKELWDMEDAFLNGEDAPVKPRRMGGIVRPGEEYLMAEDGPENVTMGQGGVGYVTPNDQLAFANQQQGMPMDNRANPQGGAALPNYGDPTPLVESAAPQPQQPQQKIDPLKGMTEQQKPQKYSSRLEYEAANPITANDAYWGAVGTEEPRWDGKMPLTAEQSRERYQAWEAENEKWKRETATALYNERPVLAETPSIGKPRTWTDKKGRKIKGELRGVRHFNDAYPTISDVAIIKKDDGKEYVIPLDTLDPKDQAIVMATPDYASENRMGGRNLGTYDSFDPTLPEGQRARQPQPRKTPTREQLETERIGRYGFGDADAAIREGRLGRRREAPPVYQQPTLKDGQIATTPGLAEPRGTRIVGPDGQRLPPVGSTYNQQDSSYYTQYLATLPPSLRQKFNKAMMEDINKWDMREKIAEERLRKSGKLQQPSSQPPARPAWWDRSVTIDPNAQERRLTPKELEQRGLMVDKATGQVVPIPRDSQGRPMKPATPPAGTSAPQPPAEKFDPTVPMASKAIKTLLREHTEKEHVDSLAILAGLNAPEDFIATLKGPIIGAPGFSLTDPTDRTPLDVIRRWLGLRESSKGKDHKK